MIRALLPIAVLLASLPAVAKDCSPKEQMTLKIEYTGQVAMVDEAKAAAKKAQADVASVAKAAKADMPMLKSAKLTLEPGEGGMTYRGSSNYTLASSVHVRDLMTALAEKKLSPSIAVSTTSRCEKDD